MPVKMFVKKGCPAKKSFDTEYQNFLLKAAVSKLGLIGIKSISKFDRRIENGLYAVFGRKDDPRPL